MAVTSSTFDFSLNNTFKPFTLEEMLIPYLTYKQEAEKVEEAYRELTEKSDTFKYLSETLPEGSEARKIYEGYANGLKKQAQDFSRYGLSMSNRRALTSYKRRYSGEIGRLNKADEAMQEQRKIRSALMAQGVPMIYATNNFSIDDFMDGKTPNMYAVNSNDLYTRGTAIGKGMASRTQKSGEGGNVIDGYYRDWIDIHGISQESMAAFMQSPAVQQAVDNALIEKGAVGNLGEAEMARARQSVMNGIYDSIMYEEKHSPVRNPGVPSWTDRDTSARGWAGIALQKQELALRQAEFGLKAKALSQSEDDSGAFSVGFDRRNIFTTRQDESKDRDKKLWENYKQYFYKDKNGNWHMTQKGMREYNRSNYTPSGPYGTTVPTASPFKEFVDRLDLTQTAKGKFGPNQSANLNQFINRINDVYDANMATEYYRPIDAEQYDNVMGALSRSSKEGKIRGYERRGDSLALVPSGDDIDITKLKGSDIQSASTVFGKHGKYLEVNLNTGEKIRLPYNQVNSMYSEINDGILNEIAAFENAKKSGRTAAPSLNGTMVPIDIAINERLDAVSKNMMVGIGTSTAKKQEVERGIYGY